jgi:hypothetical protein
VIARPTTDQIILDCRRELLEVIGPEVNSGAAKVSIEMLENVLRNVAMRAAHEIAWMREETAAMQSYAIDVAAGVGIGSPALQAALAALGAGPTASLHLDDVTTTYGLAGEAFSCAIDAAFASGDSAVIARGAALLDARTATEQEIKGEWGMVGRG